MVQTNRVNLASPNQLRINGQSFLDLPYDQPTYCANISATITRVRHADDIGIHRFTVRYDYPRVDGDYRYTGSGNSWINVWHI